jgi:hypothetical protein
MPERLDAILIALLKGRLMCFFCIGSRLQMLAEAARAAVDHLAESTAVRRRYERCQTCGEITETVGIEYSTR